MQQRTIELNDVEGITPGGKATLELGMGRTYHNIMLELGGSLTVADIEQINIKVNGKIIDYYHEIGALSGGEVLHALNEWRGIPVEATILEIPFERPYLMERKFREISVLGCAKPNDLSIPHVSNAVIEIKLASGAPGTATINAWADVSGARLVNLLRQTVWLPYDTNASGNLEITNPPTGLVDMIHMQAYDTGDDSIIDINSVKLWREKEIVWERNAAINNYSQNKAGIRVPEDSPTWFHVDPSERAYANEAISMVPNQGNKIVAELAEAGRLVCGYEIFAPIPFNA